MGNKEPAPPRAMTAKSFAATTLLGILSGIVALLIIGATVGPGSGTPFLPADGDVRDAPDPEVVEADLEAALVQLGTSRPFTGHGAPGVRLQVETRGDVLGWLVEAWANATTPPPLRLCSQDGVHFAAHDWIFETDGSSTGGQGAFISIPSTVPQRIGPDGDQCLARVASTGPWRLVVCVEGDGDRRGIYDAEDGRHVDEWDRCVERLAQVGL